MGQIWSLRHLLERGEGERKTYHCGSVPSFPFVSISSHGDGFFEHGGDGDSATTTTITTITTKDVDTC
jgi:hypothetical protein